MLTVNALSYHCPLQVWSVKYNSTGSKIISAGDDRAIHIYDCPMWLEDIYSNTGEEIRNWRRKDGSLLHWPDMVK